MNTGPEWGDGGHLLSLFQGEALVIQLGCQEIINKKLLTAWTLHSSLDCEESTLQNTILKTLHYIILLELSPGLYSVCTCSL